MDLDTVFGALQSEHRRRVLVTLFERQSRADGGAVQIPEDVHVGEHELHDLQLEMYHHHLPKLEDAGYVTWDRETHLVERGPDFEEVAPVLEFVRSREELPVERL